MKRLKLIVLSILTLALALMASSKGTDLWANFPAHVNQFGCAVKPITMSVVGGTPTMYYEAEAWVDTDWRQVIAEYPLSPKGRRQALKACADWMDGAERHIRQSVK